MKIIFCGSRDWTDKDKIKRVLTVLRDNLQPFTVIEGENGERDSIRSRAFRGADLIARDMAEELGISVEPHPADWDRYGRAAGPIRNKEMLNAGAHAIVAFHDDLTKSRGTRNMLDQAYAAGLAVWISTESQDDLGRFVIELKSIEKKMNER